MKRVTLFTLFIFIFPVFMFAQTQYFTFTANTGDSYSIVVTSAILDGGMLEVGDEVGLFTPNALCVGASVWTGTAPLALTAWIDDSQTGEVDGYVSGDTMAFKIWDQSSDTEFAATPTYAQGNDTFGSGAFASVALAAIISAVEDKSETLVPKAFALSQNYPNPFNPETIIRYELPNKTNVKLRVFNLLGEEIITLVDNEQNSGYYFVHWNGSDQNGRLLGSGLYLYRLEAGDFVAVKKVTILK